MEVNQWEKETEKEKGRWLLIGPWQSYGCITSTNQPKASWKPIKMTWNDGQKVKQTLITNTDVQKEKVVYMPAWMSLMANQSPVKTHQEAVWIWCIRSGYIMSTNQASSAFEMNDVRSYLCSSCFIVAVIWLVFSSSRVIMSFFCFIPSSDVCQTATKHVNTRPLCITSHFIAWHFLTSSYRHWW